MVTYQFLDQTNDLLSIKLRKVPGGTAMNDQISLSDALQVSIDGDADGASDAVLGDGLDFDPGDGGMDTVNIGDLTITFDAD